MKLNTLIAAALIVSIAISVFSLAQPQAIQNSPAVAANPQQRIASGFEYSRLVKDANDRYVWHYGEEILGRNQPWTIEQMTRQVNVDGSRVIRPSEDTLLNNFGAQGWEVFWVDNNADGATTWRMRRTR